MSIEFDRNARAASLAALSICEALALARAGEERPQALATRAWDSSDTVGAAMTMALTPRAAISESSS